jgi:hypothetical protein
MITRESDAACFANSQSGVNWTMSRDITVPGLDQSGSSSASRTF